MPFCPQCETEYIKGTIRCSECDVRLVRKLKKKIDTTPQIKEAHLCQAQDFMEASIIKSMLAEQNIPHRDTGSFNGMAGLQTFVSPTQGVDIYVPDEYLNIALEIIKKIDFDDIKFTDEDINEANSYDADSTDDLP